MKKKGKSETVLNSSINRTLRKRVIPPCGKVLVEERPCTGILVGIPKK